MLFTTMRFMVFFGYTNMEMFGGPEVNEWVGPWTTDVILGALAPVMAYLAFTKRGPRIWGLLIAYNCVGDFDYAMGFVTQILNPQVLADGQTILTAIGVAFCLQFLVICLLFRKNTLNHFATH